MNKISTAQHASEQIVSHRNLKSRFGTAFVAGCLTLSLCPAVALAAQPGQNGPQGDMNGNPPAMQQFNMSDSGAPYAPQGEAPDGQAPQGNMPEGQAPSGQAPQDEAPDGQAPDGQAPNMQQGPFGSMPRTDAFSEQVKDILQDQFGVSLPDLGENGAPEGFQPGNPADAPELPEGAVNVQQIIDAARDVLREYSTEDLSTKLANPEFVSALQDYAKAMTEQRLAMFASNAHPSFDNPSDLPAAPEGEAPEGAPEAPEGANPGANVDGTLLSQIIDVLMDAFGYLA